MDELLDDPWNDLEQTLTPLLTGWCRRCSPQTNPERIRQQLLAHFKRRLHEIAPIPLRRWLLQQGQRAWLDLREELADSPRFAFLWRAEALQDLLERLSVEMDWQLHEEASQRVRERVGPVAWTAYQLTVLEGYPCAETADELGSTADTIEATALQVKDLLRSEATRLEQRLDELLGLIAAEPAGGLKESSA